MVEYVEIVHLTPEILNIIKNRGEKQRDIADRILSLDAELKRKNIPDSFYKRFFLDLKNLYPSITHEGVHYFTHAVESSLPEIPLDTQIRVGGALLETCVSRRVYYLKKNGFYNVAADDTISYSMDTLFSR